MTDAILSPKEFLAALGPEPNPLLVTHDTALRADRDKWKDAHDKEHEHYLWLSKLSAEGDATIDRLKQMLNKQVDRIKDLEALNLSQFDLIQEHKTTIEHLRLDLTTARSVCAEAYQFAGAVGAPERVLDNLSDAANGGPLRHETFLPVTAEECVNDIGNNPAAQRQMNALALQHDRPMPIQRPQPGDTRESEIYIPICTHCGRVVETGLCSDGCDLDGNHHVDRKHQIIAVWKRVDTFVRDEVAQPAFAPLYRCNSPTLGPSRSSVDHNLILSVSQTYSASIEVSTDGGKTWTPETRPATGCELCESPTCNGGCIH